MSDNNANANVPKTPSDSQDSNRQTSQSTTYADILKKRQEGGHEITETQSYESADINLNSEVSASEKTRNSREATTTDSGLRNDTDNQNNCESDLFGTNESSSLAEDISGTSRDGMEDINEETVSELTEDQLMNETDSLRDDSKLSIDEGIARKRKYTSSSSEEGESYEDDDESEGLAEIADNYPNALKWELRVKDPDLPEMVTVLNTRHGGKVYLVGTAHFSVESQEDVAKTIRATQPDVLLMELCKNRVNIFSLDEETILRESKNMTFEKIRSVIRQNGFVQGVVYLLLLNMSAHLTKQLGTAPGGEFRRAYAEAKKIPGCVILLGDRSINVTLHRAVAALSWWCKLKVAWYLLTNRDPISKEELEKTKQRDLLEKTLADMTGEFPELGRIFVEERDTYLTYSLQQAAMPSDSNASPNGILVPVVVGVVGIGHVPGIVAKWEKVKDEDIIPIMSIPKPSKSAIIVRKCIRYSIYGLILYGGYRILPETITRKPVSFLQATINSFINRINRT